MKIERKIGIMVYLFVITFTSLWLESNYVQAIEPIKSVISSPTQTETTVENVSNTKQIAIDLLKFEEGYRSTPYIGTEGYLHIGYGRKLSNRKGLNPEDYTTKTNPKSEEILLSHRVDSMLHVLKTTGHRGIFLELSDERQAILLSMMYQMGFSGLYEFTNMWKAIYLGDYEDAAKAMLNSKWAKQTPARANRHAETMRTGILL